MHPATATPVVPATDRLPVVVVGAGPVGLAAAANLAERGEAFLVLERGVAVGAAVRAWGHVGMFSPWRYNIDRAARRLLETADWRSPDHEALPTGRDLVDQYLVPLARNAAIAPFLRFNAEVMAIGRKDFDKVRTKGRDVQPFKASPRVGRGDGNSGGYQCRAERGGDRTLPDRTASAPSASVNEPITSGPAFPMCCAAPGRDLPANA